MRVGMELVAAGSGIEEGAGGAGGYFHGIIPPIAADDRVSELRLYVPAWYDRAEEWAGLPKVRIVRCKVPRKRPLRVGYEQVALPLLARNDRVDVLFSTGNFRPLLYRRPNVMGLHAIQHFLLGEDIGALRSAYVRFAVPRSARTATRVIVVSETLRADAAKLFSLDPARVTAVPMGPSPWAADLVEQEALAGVSPYALEDGSPYVLCISRLYFLKNHRRQIEAFAQLTRERDVPHKLVIVGGEGDVSQAELESVAAQEGITDRVVFLGRVPQPLVAPLYKGADAITYVSLYETFGHPVLEAFAAETPLLTSARGGTAEVAGGAARLADPEDVPDITAGLAEVLFDDAARERLVAAGRARVREFSWSACARGTVDVLAGAVRPH